MGLAPLIVVLKTLATKTGSNAYNKAARFWTNIVGFNFAIGVVIGIPMEFDFGANLSRFSQLTRSSEEPCDVTNRSKCSLVGI
jgi:cytochrome d ubiquinol oxidase subunit I